MKLWNIEIFLLDESGREMEASLFTKATYNLHPSFANPTQSTSLPLLPSPPLGFSRPSLTFVDRRSIHDGDEMLMWGLINSV
jgi:hypothetical protein